MNSRRLFKRWKEQQTHLLKDLGRWLRRSRRHGREEDIHQLRVTARRLRLLTRLGAAWYGKEVSHAYRDWTRKVSAATDAVRDLDVALEWLDTQSTAGLLCQGLRARRNLLWRRNRRRLTPLPEAHLKALSDTRGGRKREMRLARRCARFLARLRERVEEDAPAFAQLNIHQQHDFRRVVRRWRYLRELQLPDNRHPADRLLRRLLLLQEALGNRQNLLLADTALASVKTPFPEVGVLRRSLTKEIGRAEQSILRQIKAFV